jgi:hypothetical protein
MKSLRIAICLVFLLMTVAGFAQSDAQKTFDHLKTLNGHWEGKASNGKDLKVDFRPTSGGSAVLSEILGEEDMITMFHMDNDRVMATHYCMAGNQPRMVASASPDGKTITFNFVDGTNITSPKAGHMDHLVITIADADHHTEDWTFVKDGVELKRHFDLARAKGAGL